MSHLECIRRAGEKGEFPFIILEDDVRFTLMPHWKKNIDEIIAELPEDCDVLSLTCHMYGKEKEGIWKKDIKNAGAVAYLITEKGYNNYMKLFYNKSLIISKNLNLTDNANDSGLTEKFNFYYIKPVLFLLDNLLFYSTHNINNRNILIKPNNNILIDY